VTEVLRDFPQSLQANSETVQGVLKELYNGILNVTVRRVLRELLHLRPYKLCIVQHLEHLKR
jgi:hypothetical protein